MQMSFGSLYRVHAACGSSRSPSSAWAATRRLSASRSNRSTAYTVQAAEQQTAGSEPSKVKVKDTQPPKQKGQSPAEKFTDHSADANISDRDPKVGASVKETREGKPGQDGEERQKKAEQMMDDGEGAGGHGYS
ncbi:hypothetical protein ABBQ32_007167 [Trebouxia sp. C0010 RCD-2024]